MFGFAEEQIAAFGMTFGVGGLMLYMLFIIGQQASRVRQSSAPSDRNPQ